MLVSFFFSVDFETPDTATNPGYFMMPRVLAGVVVLLMMLHKGRSAVPAGRSEHAITVGAATRRFVVLTPEGRAVSSVVLLEPLVGTAVAWFLKQELAPAWTTLAGFAFVCMGTLMILLSSSLNRVTTTLKVKL